LFVSLDDSYNIDYRLGKYLFPTIVQIVLDKPAIRATAIIHAFSPMVPVPPVRVVRVPPSAWIAPNGVADRVAEIADVFVFAEDVTAWHRARVELT
jgi:hypothetical protein